MVQTVAVSQKQQGKLRKNILFTCCKALVLGKFESPQSSHFKAGDRGPPSPESEETDPSRLILPCCCCRRGPWPLLKWLVGGGRCGIWGGPCEKLVLTPGIGPWGMDPKDCRGYMDTACGGGARGIEVTILVGRGPLLGLELLNGSW